MSSKLGSIKAAAASNSMMSEQDHYYSSEDEDRWECEPRPLINVLTFGWTEDGRLGYPPPNDENAQLCPRPIPDFEQPNVINHKQPVFICKAAAAGSRHSLFLMIDCAKDEKKVISKEDRDRIKIQHRRRPRKVMITGLNQTGLCEEAGNQHPIDLPWQSNYDRPVAISAGRGTTFVTTKAGHVYSSGNGLFGMLGHGNDESLLLPRRIMSLERKLVLQLSAGAFHVACMTDEDLIYGWGRNHCGQIGLGYENDFVSVPTAVIFPAQAARYRPLEVACGFQHTIALMQRRVLRRKQDSSADLVHGIDDKVAAASSTSQSKVPSHKAKSVSEDDMEEVFTNFIFCWGDESRSQLGSGDREYRSRPQENRYASKLATELNLTYIKIRAGGHHNLALIKHSGQVISWGAGDSGQLGHGLQFDDPHPRIINNLEKAIDISAGLRHSVAVVEAGSSEVYAWGLNSHGELGLGDMAIRLQPTKITGIKTAKVLQAACGDRHTVLVLSHKPMTAIEMPALKPYFQILSGFDRTVNKDLVKSLKYQLFREGIDGKLLDDPMTILPDQAGSDTKEMKNDQYEKGLRYCLDTKCDPFDWRRKSLEACFEVHLPKIFLRKVCLSCARNCLHMYRLRPYIRQRSTGDTCDCRTHSGMCVSVWTPIRAVFDTYCGDDTFIGPKQVRKLLKKLRAPFPVETADVEDCLNNLAEGVEDAEEPRIRPGPFEKWYRRYYDEEGEDGGQIDADASADVKG